jgi:hypothetical protein
MNGLKECDQCSGGDGLTIGLGCVAIVQVNHVKGE